MAGTKTHNSDLNLQGKAIISDVPNATGTILTYNSTSKEVSTRTNSEIISDLGLNTDLTAYVKKAGDTMTGTLNLSTPSNISITRDMTSALSVSAAREFTKLIGANGVTDIYGHLFTTDSSGNINLTYGYLGGGSYSTKNAIRWSSDQKVFIGVTGSTLPSSSYALYVSGDSYNSGNIALAGNINTTTGELIVQRQGVNRIRTNTNSIILSGETSNGIVYVRPSGDSVSTSQVMFNSNNTSQYPDNYNLLLGTQTTVGSSIFHTNNNVAAFGYGVWMGHNLQFNGTDFIQPRGSLRSLGFTTNFHKGFSFNIAEGTGTNGSVISLTEVAKVSTTGTITTLSDGNSTQWNSAYNALPNLATLNTVQTFTATKNFGVMQKFQDSIKYFDNISAHPYLKKYENRALYAPSGVTTITGNVKITFPIPMAATMWSIKVKVLQYVQISTNTKTVQVPMTVTVTGYNSSAGSPNINFGAIGEAFHSNFVGVRTGIDAITNNKIVWLDFNSALSYPKVILEEFIVHHSGATSSLLDGAWNIDITADETNYTNQTTILKEDFKELSDLGTNLKVFGNGITKNNLSNIDVFTMRNASMWASGGANRPAVGNAAIVNFTPYNSGGTYGFSLAARLNRLYFVTEENTTFGSWNEIYHTGNFNPANYAPVSHTHTWSQITGTPTTLSGYGITDGMPTNYANTVSATVFQGDFQAMPVGSYVATVSNTSTNLPFTQPGGLISFGQTGTNNSTRILGARDNSDNLWFQSGGGTGNWRQLASREWVNSYGLGVTALSNTLTDFNTISSELGTNARLFSTATSAVTNAPTGSAFPTGLFISRSTNVQNVLVFGGYGTSSTLAFRSKLNSTDWNDWVYAWTTKNFSQTDINNWNSAFNFTNNFTTNYNDIVAIEALSGTGFLRKDGNGLWSLTSTPVPDATSTTGGKVKLYSDTVQSVLANAVSAITGRTYGAQFNPSGQLVVNVPWTDTTYTNGTGLNLTGTTFSVNFGTTAGTAAQGNDSRIINGQTAFGWGNHALAGYALANGSNATDTWSNAAKGIVYNPYIPGKTRNASGDSYLNEATYGEVAGFLNSTGISQGNPTDDWYHRIKMLNSNSAGYYTEIGVQMTGGSSMWYKRYEAGTPVGWFKLWDSNNFTQTNINSWNTAASYAHFHSNLVYLDNINQYLGTTQTPTFNGVKLNNNLGYGQLIFGEDNLGGESGLVDVDGDRLYAARKDEYIKYASRTDGFQGLNYHIGESILTIGREVGIDEDKLQLAGNISVDALDINAADMQLVLNPLYDKSGNVSTARNAHIYVVAINTITLPNKPILGQRFELHNESGSTIDVVHQSVGTLFSLPAFSKITGIASGRGFKFDANPVPYVQYDI